MVMESVLKGKIIMKEGATLTIEGNATFMFMDGKDALSNVSGEGTVIVTGKYTSQNSGETEDGIYRVVESTVNEGISLIVKGGLSFADDAKAW